MTIQESSRDRTESGFAKHVRIVWALIMRELSTRYGRENIGFVWLIVEPLLFAGGLSYMWNFERGTTWAHNISITAFVLTGYLPLLLHRQVIGHGTNSVNSNIDLLYHKQITPLHMFMGRCLTEFFGVTLAASVALSGAMLVGVLPPLQNFEDFGLVIAGWMLVWAQAAAVSLVLVGLAMLFDWVERVANIANYLSIPLTGAFYLLAWVPMQIRPVILALPFIHGWEMLRKGFFGTNIDSYWNLSVAFIWLVGNTCLGLTILSYARDKLEIE